MEITPSIFFHAKNASVHFGMEHSGAKQRSISFVLTVDADEQIQTLDNQALNDIDWSMTCIEGNKYNDFAAEQKAIGFLSYFSRSDEVGHGHVGVAIESITFNWLWDLVTRGLLPDRVLVSVYNLLIKSSTNLIWDVVNNPHVNVKEVSFSFSTAQENALTVAESSSSNDANISVSRFVRCFLRG